MRLGAEDAPVVREGCPALGVSMASTARGPPRRRRREAPRFPAEAAKRPYRRRHAAARRTRERVPLMPAG